MHSRRWEKFVESLRCSNFSTKFFYEFIHEKLAVGEISRYITPNVREGFVKRVRSPWISVLFLSFSLSLCFFPSHSGISSCRVKIFIPPPVENYGPNEILPRRPIFLLRDIGIFLSPPPSLYSDRMDILRLDAGIFLAGRDYFPLEKPLWAFVLHEIARKCIVFKGMKIQFWGEFYKSPDMFVAQQQNRQMEFMCSSKYSLNLWLIESTVKCEVTIHFLGITSFDNFMVRWRFNIKVFSFSGVFTTF